MLAYGLDCGFGRRHVSEGTSCFNIMQLYQTGLLPMKTCSSPPQIPT